VVSPGAPADPSDAAGFFESLQPTTESERATAAPSEQAPQER
jgi:hypothetical protein